MFSFENAKKILSTEVMQTFDEDFDEIVNRGFIKEEMRDVYKGFVQKCPYCGREVYLMTSKEFYSKDYGFFIYMCGGYPNCKSYVTTSRNTVIPTGVLANTNLRRKRRVIHQLEDKMITMGYKKNDVYSMLSERMGIPPERCHIGMFDEKKCREAFNILQPITECVGEFDNNVELSLGDTLN